jgi:Rieske Fe-S protein
MRDVNDLDGCPPHVEPASPRPRGERDSCEHCTQPDRRQFIQFSATAILAIAAAKVVKGAGNGEERTYPVPREDGVTIDHDAQVILVRNQQRMYAFNLACPHENTALRWRAEDHRFQCPRHQSKYQPDGTFISGRATRNMDRFAVHRSGDSLVVDLSKLYRSDQQPAEWAKAFVTL